MSVIFLVRITSNLKLEEFEQRLLERRPSLAHRSKSH